MSWTTWRRITFIMASAEDLIKRIEPNSIALSFWSPALFRRQKKYGKRWDVRILAKSPKRGHSGPWTDTKTRWIHGHQHCGYSCFPWWKHASISGNESAQRRSPVTREMVWEAMKQYPHYSRYQLAELLGCSEQTIDRRLRSNNIRGGKKQVQTRVKLVGRTWKDTPMR